MKIYAEQSTTIERYHYGPDMAPNTACERALEKAKIAALKRVVGSQIQDFKSQECKNIDDKRECSLFESTIAYMGEGFVKDFTSTENRGNDGKNDFCEVKLTANVSRPNGKPDPNFNLNAKIEPDNVFEDGSKDFLLKGIVSQKSYIHMFNWYPSEDNKNYLCISEYFKNEYSMPITNIKFPPSGQITLSFPKSLERDYVSEYVVIIATKEKLNIPCITDTKTNSITIERKKLLEIINNLDRRTWTKHMLAYKIIR